MINWDFFVYARGIEQSDGFKLRTAPEYIGKDVIKGCQGFFSTRERSKTFLEELGSDDSRAWNNTFVFLPIKQFNCCIFMRAVKVESPDTGEYYTDFQDRPVWSLEGVCCEYDKAGYFFASLPSVILWFKDNEGTSLCTMLSSGRIHGRLEIDDDYVIDPMHMGFALPEKAELMSGETQSEAFSLLCDRISCSAAPFPFIFGPLAEQIFRAVGGAYRITECIPAAGQLSSETVSNDFEAYTPVKLRQERPVGVNKSYVLKLGINSAGSYSWHITELEKQDSVMLSSGDIGFDPEKGIDVLKLLSEAELIRELVTNIGLSVEPYTSDLTKVYQFTKEV